MSNTHHQGTPRGSVETDKRIRREIANSNERRRMQSINTGFNSLRTMLPKHEGEKLSKAAILQHTAEYIDSLEQEKTRLLGQACQLKKLISSIVSGQQDVESLVEHQLVKRIKTEHLESNMSSDSSDEGIHCHPSPNIDLDNIDDLRSELVHVRKTVDRERKLRMQLEDQVKQLETQLYPERVKEIAHSVQTKYTHHGMGVDSEDGSMDNSETEDAAAVASLVTDGDENVIAETIEIETGDPESPSGHHQVMHATPTTIVIQAPGGGSYSAPIHFQTSSSGMTSDSTTRVMHVTTAGGSRQKGGNKRTAAGGSKPGAIALPIDVPFIGGTSHNNSSGTITLQIVNSNGHDTSSSSVSNTSRHNLETIVEAIRHLEGDHLFKDDPDAAAVTVGYEEEEVVETQAEVEIQPKPLKVLKVSPEQLGAIRSQVIKCIPVSTSGGSGRPGVIVAKNP